MNHNMNVKFSPPGKKFYVHVVIHIENESQHERKIFYQVGKIGKNVKMTTKK